MMMGRILPDDGKDGQHITMNKVPNGLIKGTRKVPRSIVYLLSLIDIAFRKLDIFNSLVML